MSEKKFTKGPWKVADESVVTADYTRCICTMEADGGYEVPNEEREANAALIGAAPELFEALQRAEKRFREEGQSLDADECLSALAKATKLSN